MRSVGFRIEEFFLQRDVAVAKSGIFLIRTGFQETGCVRYRRRHGNPLATIATDDHYIMLKVSFDVRKHNAT